MKKFTNITKHVDLRHTVDRNKVTLQNIDVRTSVLNERFGLDNHQQVAWTVKEPFETDGASTHAVGQTLMILWSLITVSTFFFTVHASFYAMFALLSVYLVYRLNPLAWWILTPAIIHDWIWRELYADAFVYNKTTKEIERPLGVIELSRGEGNLIMLEKMESFFAPFFDRGLVFGTLQVVRWIKK